MSKKVLILLSIILLVIPVISVSNHHLFAQEEITDTSGDKVGDLDEENPFKEIEDELPDFFTAKNLMRDFKILSLIILIILSLIMLFFVRKYIKKHMTEPLKAFVFSAIILNSFTWLLTSSLYYMFVYYEWFNMHTLNQAIHDSELWNLISKTLSTGLGSFYIAHMIDVFAAGTIIYFIFTFMFALLKKRV